MISLEPDEGMLEDWVKLKKGTVDFAG